MGELHSEALPPRIPRRRKESNAPSGVAGSTFTNAGESPNTVGYVVQGPESTRVWNSNSEGANRGRFDAYRHWTMYASKLKSSAATVNASGAEDDPLHAAARMTTAARRRKLASLIARPPRRLGMMSVGTV